MPDRRDVHDIGVRGVDAHSPDLAAVGEPYVLPCLAGVGRLVDPISRREVSAKAPFAHPDIDNVRVGLSNRHGADRTGFEERVRDVAPRHAGVVGLPHATASGAHVVRQRLCGDAGDRGHAPAAIGTDAAPLQRVVETAAARLCEQRMCERHDGERPEGKAESVHGGFVASGVSVLIAPVVDHE